MEEKYENAKEILKKYGQEHLLLKYNSLNEEDKKVLIEQITKIDFEQILELYEDTKKEVALGEEKIEPISHIDKEKISEEEKQKYITLGENAIRNGELAFVTMAGGQGTRLGHKGPKGTFELGVEGNKTLFEIICDTLKEGSSKYGVVIPWYLMTSKENNKDTVDFFEKKGYFGYPKEAVHFFVQGELPMIDTNGKILLDETGKIKEAADGHGGIFESLAKSASLEDMQKRGVKWIFVGGVDNPLVKMVDALIIGYSIDNGFLATGKSLVKVSPEEKVGVFCKKNGRPSVIEYTEISKEMAELCNEEEELVYGEGHVLMNLFNIKSLEQIAKNKLPYHSAFKKAKYISQTGEVVEPESPNAYKFESFIFDAFSRLEDMGILRVIREEEFAPVKNANGVDSPETARELYNNYQKNKRN